MTTTPSWSDLYCSWVNETILLRRVMRDYPFALEKRLDQPASEPVKRIEEPMAQRQVTTKRDWAKEKAEREVALFEKRPSPSL